MIFEYHQNTLGIAANWLISNEIISEGNYKKMCSVGHIKKLTVGGNGRRALVAFESIPERFKKQIIEKVGDPYASAKKIIFADYINWVEENRCFRFEEFV